MLGGDSGPCSAPVSPPPAGALHATPPQGAGAAGARPGEGTRLVSNLLWRGAGVSLEKRGLHGLRAASQDLKGATGEIGEVRYQEAFKLEEGRLKKFFPMRVVGL